MNKRERIILGIVLIGCAALVGLLAEMIGLILALVVGYLAGRLGILERFGRSGAVEDKDHFDILIGLLLIAVLISVLVHAVAVMVTIVGVIVLVWGIPHWILDGDRRPFVPERETADVDRPQLSRGDDS